MLPAAGDPPARVASETASGVASETASTNNRDKRSAAEILKEQDTISRRAARPTSLEKFLGVSRATALVAREFICRHALHECTTGTKNASAFATAGEKEKQNKKERKKKKDDVMMEQDGEGDMEPLNLAKSFAFLAAAFD